LIRDLLQKIQNRAGILREIVSFLKERKAYWLVPLVLVLVAAAFLFFIATQPAVTPFVYTLF
jgi:hypothetical protein